MIYNAEKEKYSTTLSVERLESYIKSENDTIDDVMNRYADNIRISQALYPELSVLEVTLRNAIDFVLRKYISETWIEDEINNPTWLKPNDYKLLQQAYEKTEQECKSASKVRTAGKVIANLNFGFWTNLCAKKYSIKIWNKMYCFKGVFVNYPNTKPEIAVIAQKLYSIRKLRNRIFHYEQIFQYPEKTLSLYNLILELLSYLPQDDFNLIKKTSNFLYVYNEMMKNKSKI